MAKILNRFALITMNDVKATVLQDIYLKTCHTIVRHLILFVKLAKMDLSIANQLK